MAREVQICNQEKTTKCCFFARLTPQQDSNACPATSKESAEPSVPRRQQTSMRRARSDASKTHQLYKRITINDLYPLNPLIAVDLNKHFCDECLHMTAAGNLINILTFDGSQINGDCELIFKARLVQNHQHLYEAGKLLAARCKYTEEGVYSVLVVSFAPKLRELGINSIKR